MIGEAENSQRGISIVCGCAQTATAHTAPHSARMRAEFAAPISRAAIVAEALAILPGTPFQHQQRLPGIAIDCIGLIAVPAARLGHEDAGRFLIDAACKGYGVQPDPKMMLRTLARYCDEIPKASAGVGDFLWMRFEAEPQHFALITWLDDPPTDRRYPVGIVHASASVGKVIEHGLDATWRERVARAYRYRGTVP